MSRDSFLGSFFFLPVFLSHSVSNILVFVCIFNCLMNGGSTGTLSWSPSFILPVFLSKSFSNILFCVYPLISTCRWWVNRASFLGSFYSSLCLSLLFCLQYSPPCSSFVLLLIECEPMNWIQMLNTGTYNLEIKIRQIR